MRGSWEFVQHLLTPEAQSVWHAGTGYLAVNTGGYEGPEAVERNEEFPQFEIAAQQLADSEVDENTAGCMMGVMSEARAAAEEGWEAALTGDATPPRKRCRRRPSGSAAPSRSTTAPWRTDPKSRGSCYRSRLQR